MFERKTLSILLVILITASLILPIGPVLLVEGQGKGRAGTSLEANVTALAINLTRYSWTITKLANETEIHLSRDNVLALVEYTVTVFKDLEYISYYLEGRVCVRNKGDYPTENLSIKIDVFTGAGWDIRVIDDHPVDVSEKPDLMPGESHCYSYKVDIPVEYWGYDKFKVTANVTITNHSGRLGQPYGPSPSYTTTRIYVKEYDCVVVEDTSGYTWSTCESAYWTYTMAFEYDPEKGEFYEFVNTATIVETGQSSSWTLKVYQEIARYATISGVVFWDNNYNGMFESNDKPFGGVAVHLYRFDVETGEWLYMYTNYSNDDGYYYFEVETGFLYKVEVVRPECGLCDMVIMTTPSYYEVEVEEPIVYGGYDFGFVCLKKLTGAYSKGYWSWSQYNRRTGQWQTRLTLNDVTYINSMLGTNFMSPKELADYLISPVLGNMTTALMQQLIATLLNLKYGYINGETVLYYDGKYISTIEVVDNAKNALWNGSRADQEYWKDLLDALNNNNVYYVYTVDC